MIWIFTHLLTFLLSFLIGAFLAFYFKDAILNFLNRSNSMNDEINAIKSHLIQISGFLEAILDKLDKIGDMRIETIQEPIQEPEQATQENEVVEAPTDTEAKSTEQVIQEDAIQEATEATEATQEPAQEAATETATEATATAVETTATTATATTATATRAHVVITPAK